MKRFTKAEVTAIRNAAFASAVLQGLATMGARLVYGPKPNMPAEWELPTKYGPLSVTVYDTWVACRFTDAEGAAKHTGCNPNTGKWNHHFDTFPSKGAAQCDGMYVLTQLKNVWQPD